MENDLRPASPEESPLLRELGIEPRFADDAKAPPVDVEKLRRYYRNELNAGARQEVRDCIATFRSWYGAFMDVIRARGEADS